MTSPAEVRTRVVVVDDEPPSRELMKRYVSDRSELELVMEAGSGWDAVAAIEESSPDLVLLDVEMPGLDGFGVLRELEERHLELPSIIFVTAYDRYAVRAFEAHAVDYLMKPVTEERFGQAIQRCLAQHKRRRLAVRALQEDALRSPPQRLLVRHRGRILPVAVDAIDWVQAEGDYVRIHAGDQAFLVERSLTEMLELLQSKGFARIHRGAVVNMDSVRELRPLGSGRYRLELEDGTRLVVSRTYSPRFRDSVL